MTALKPHAKFCENCGASIAAEPVPAPENTYYQPQAAPAWQAPPVQPSRPAHKRAWFWVLIAFAALIVLVPVGRFIYGFGQGFAQGWRDAVAEHSADRLPNSWDDFHLPEGWEDWLDLFNQGDYFLAGYDFFFDLEEFSTINPDITGDASLAASDLYGVWICDLDESWQYFFAAEGVGFRGGGAGLFTGMVVEFEWALNDGILSICANLAECDSLEACELPEFWAVHMVDDVMTITSQQIENQQFSYFRQ